MIIYLHIMKRMITTTLILLINHVFNFPPTAAFFFNQIGTFPNYKMNPRRRPLSGPKQSSSLQMRFKSTNFSTQGSSRVAPVPSTLPGWHWWIARDQNEVPGCSPQIGCLPVTVPGANQFHAMGIQMHNKTCEKNEGNVKMLPKHSRIKLVQQKRHWWFLNTSWPNLSNLAEMMRLRAWIRILPNAEAPDADQDLCTPWQRDRKLPVNLSKRVIIYVLSWPEIWANCHSSTNTIAG